MMETAELNSTQVILKTDISKKTTSTKKLINIYSDRAKYLL